jgi:hypothetical protein
MPLSLGQIEVKAIVDWNVEWDKKGKEGPRNPIRRGMIVRVEGDPSQESVEEVWVTFGPDLGKDKFEFGTVSVPMVKVAPRELNLVYGAHTKIATEAWRRTFNVPEHVGNILQSRTARASKPKIVDSLQLTGVSAKGPIEDGPAAKKADDDE